MFRTLLLSVSVMLVLGSSAMAQGPTYVKDVEPFLKKYCLECHSGGKAKAGVNLETYDSIIKGGKKRKSVVPGDPDKSPVVTSTEGKSGHKMPPKKYTTQPTAKEIEVLREWVKAGAKREADAKTTSAVERRFELRPAPAVIAEKREE